jgi:hypothetical protein
MILKQNLPYPSYMHQVFGMYYCMLNIEDTALIRKTPLLPSDTLEYVFGKVHNKSFAVS